MLFLGMKLNYNSYLYILYRNKNINMKHILNYISYFIAIILYIPIIIVSMVLLTMFWVLFEILELVEWIFNKMNELING